MNVLPLSRLSAESIARLSRAIIGENGDNPDVTDLLIQETEGNCFFIVETIRALAADAGQLRLIGTQTLSRGIFTGGMHQLVQRRLDRLPLDDQPLLRLAAMVGRDIDLDVLRYVDEEFNTQDWLYRCANAAFLTVRDGVWTFAHDKFREGILSNIAPEAKKQLHELSAEALEAVYGNNHAYYVRILHHWRDADQFQKHLQYALLVGAHFHQTGLNFEPILTFLREALPLLDLIPVSKQDKAQLLSHIGNVEWHLRHIQPALECYEETLELARQEQMLPFIIKSLMALSRIKVELNRFDEAVSEAQEAHLLAQVEEKPLLLDALINRAAVAHLSSHIADIEGYARAALDLAEEMNAPMQITSSGNMLATALALTGRPQAALPYMEKAVAMARKLGILSHTVHTLNNLAELKALLGDLEGAAANIEESIRIAMQLNYHILTAFGHFILADVQNKREEYDKARTTYYEGLKVLGTTVFPGTLPEVTARLIVLEQRLGNPQAARQKLHEAIEFCEHEPNPHVILSVLLNIVHYYLLVERIQDAEKVYTIVLSHPKSDPSLQVIIRETQHKLLQKGVLVGEVSPKTWDLQAVLTDVKTSIQE